MKPYHKAMIDRIKSVTDARIYFHSCEAIFPLIEHLIDIGVDVLNPIQPLAKGMDAEALKKTYGDRITFCGGLDVQKLLPTGSIEEIRAESRESSKYWARTEATFSHPHTTSRATCHPRTLSRCSTRRWSTGNTRREGENRKN